MKKVYILSTLIVFTLFTMCGEVHCPGFSDDLLAFLPYKGQEIIKFTNGTYTTSFQIIEKNVDESYSFKKNCDCECEISAHIQTSLNNELNISIRYSIIVTSKDTIHEVLFRHGINDYLRYPQKQVNYKDNYSSHSYNNVILMQSNSNDKIKKVVIAVGYGIIRFTEKPEKTWYLVEKE